MKGNLLQGTARGRLGNVVAKVVHGKQIYANYQPNVSNPNTELQRKCLEIANYYKSIDARICDIRISTRPDAISKEKLDFLKMYNVTIIV